MALKSISISGNFDWCPVENHRNNLISFSSNNSIYTNSNNFIYLLDVNLNSDSRNLEIVNKSNFEDLLKNDAETNGNSIGGEFVTCFEWMNSSSFLDSDSDDDLSKGIIVGGMNNGDIFLLNPNFLFDSSKENGNHFDYDSIILNRTNVHDKTINCLEYNRHKNHLIATGGDDGQLFITDIENLYAPTSYDPYVEKNNLQKITCLNWNKKVSHILATSSNTGTTVIWDLKIKKSAVSFGDPYNRTRTSSLCWICNQPTQILVSYDDDRNPCMQLWDLRNSNYPIKEILGHTKGINNVCFSTIDSNLLLSSGKDVTKCWFNNNSNFDLFSEISSSGNNTYSKWSPFIPDLFACSSFGESIQIHSINSGNKMTSKYIPSFYKREAGVCFGFGGKICSFSNSDSGTNSGLTGGMDKLASGSSSVSKEDIQDSYKTKQGKAQYYIKCHIYPMEKELISEADIFEKYLNNGNYVEFCENKIKTSEDEHERLTWKILQLLCTSQRSDIVKELGFDMNNVLEKVMNHIGRQPGFIFDQLLPEEVDNNTTNQMTDTQTNMIVEPTLMIQESIQRAGTSFDVDPEKFFRELGEKTEHEKSKAQSKSRESVEPLKNHLEDNASTESSSENKTVVTNWNSGIESIIKECVLIGNIETAVELCIHQNRMADALLISSFGGVKLWNKTKNIYINKQNDSFLRNINYILDNKFDVLVKNIDLAYWIEALSILCTYALNTPNFNALCETLAKRLQNEKFDIRASSICYLCACNFAETIEIWNNLPTKKGSLLNVLQDFVEKMAVLKSVIKFNEPNALMNQKINQYAELLANSGRLKPAMAFLCLIQEDQSIESLILRDRIFNSASHEFVDSHIPAPSMPFQIMDVKPSPMVQTYLLSMNKTQATTNTSYQMQSQNNPNMYGINPNMQRQGVSTSSIGMNQPISMTSRTSNVVSPSVNAINYMQPPSTTRSVSNVNMVTTNNAYTGINATTNNAYTGINATTNNAYSGINVTTNLTNRPVPKMEPPQMISPYGVSSNFANMKTPPTIPPMQSNQFHSQTISPYSSSQNVNQNPNQSSQFQYNMPKAPVGAPPMQTQETKQQSYSNFQNLQPPIPSTPPTPNIGNTYQPSVINQNTNTMTSNNFVNQTNQINQFPKREAYDESSFPSNNIVPLSDTNKNTVIPPNNFMNSCTDTQGIKYNAPMYSNTPSASGISTTSPIAGALTVPPGMPVPWPIPTMTQQLGSTTQSTAQENKKIQTATKEQNGVMMNINDIQMVKRVISNLLNGYTAQEVVKKKAEDVSMKVSDFFEKLDNGAFNKNINDHIISICNYINANDFKTTNKLITDLSRNLWDSNNKSWIMALKRIIPKC